MPEMKRICLLAAVVAALGVMVTPAAASAQIIELGATTAPLAVQRGDVVGLTVPTWAPVLSIQLPSSKFAYRQGRSTNCGNPPATNQAQAVKQTATYKCNYAGTRVEYSATEITSPVAVNP